MKQEKEKEKVPMIQNENDLWEGHASTLHLYQEINKAHSCNENENAITRNMTIKILLQYWGIKV